MLQLWLKLRRFEQEFFIQKGGSDSSFFLSYGQKMEILDTTVIWLVSPNETMS